jgi:serine/threonine protein kinase
MIPCDAHASPDIHIANILLRLPDSLDALSIEEFYKRYKEPIGEEVKYKDGRPLPKSVPARCYYPAWLGKKSEDVSLSEARILLTDFGVAFSPSQEPKCESYTPHPFTPPESVFLPSQPLSFSADIWGLACTLWSLVADSNVFCIWSDSTEKQVELLGKLRAEWWERWQATSKRFDPDGARKAKYQYPQRTWDVRFEDCIREPREEAKMEGLGAEEREAFLKLLKSMLKYLPEERISAEDVLNSEWIQKWAIPELDKIGSQ